MKENATQGTMQLDDKETPVATTTQEPCPVEAPPLYSSTEVLPIVRELSISGDIPFKGDKSYDRWAVEFHLSTVADGGRLGRTNWAATFRFNVRDIGDLMREGLFWSPEDCIPELGAYKATDPNGPDRIIDGVVVRHYRLVDKSARWHAHFRIIATNVKTLQTFRLDHLKQHQVLTCEASNSRKEIVYRWHRSFLSESINTIYDDMPLAGWWPWPKA